MLEFAGQLWSIAKPYRVRLVLGVAAGFLAGLAEPLLMLSAKVVVDVMFPTGDAVPILRLPAWAPEGLRGWLASLDAQARGAALGAGSMVAVVALIPGAMLLRGVLGYLNVYFLNWAAVRAINDLRTRLFEHLFTLPLSYLHRASTGELMSRVLSDVAALQHVLTHATATLIKDPFVLLSVLAFLLWQEPWLTTISLVAIPLCVVPILVYGRKVRRATQLIQGMYADLSQVMHESFTGIRILKAYNLERRAVRQFADASQRSVSHHMRVIRATETPGPLIEFCGALGVAVLLLYVALFARDAAITPGDLVLVLGSIFTMYRPIKSLTRLHANFVQARAASERVFELLAERSKLDEPEHPEPLRAAGADVVFDRVSFRYDDRLVLQDFSLTIRAGTLVALVGQSGSGKTTVANLLLRFYDPEAGSVRIGGTDIRRVATRELRGQIAVVTQDVILFNDTIRNNVALGRPGATDEEIQLAARHAQAHEFIVERAGGYDAPIGEKGIALSGGQRQRIAIARALLRDAPILVLDEATSALDTESEHAVQAALERLMRGRTTICIAHRLSTIERADLIVVLEEGRIVQRGRHAELIREDGVYRRLHRMQFQGAEPPAAPA